ncbi:hypothetical protein OIU34_21925 [Pararhizobium sp. BT-229]|uniref:hypothetical protein n=1 Tax=Pararhizobium sp. BT-229 TaxID=2986923 RepID=UPI0021F73BF2|nr:hypothetical protein [Pararhizobium sp. BT-229]MCV9964552.1 hypothetical protein [Pararhizobium sp. BT-229]
MAVTGIPDGGRNVRHILGKRTGRFDLAEINPGGIVQAGRLVRPAQTNGDRTYHAALDGRGLFTQLGKFDGATFLVDSTVPAIDEALKALQLRINNFDKGEIKKLWYPSRLAEYALGYLRPAARQFDEIDPERNRIGSFDAEAFDRQHEALGAKLAATCVASDGKLYNVEPMPFIAVGMTDREVTVTAEIEDASAYLASASKCVRLFGIAEREAATAFALELASRFELEFGGLPFEFDGQHPEFFVMNADAWMYRIVGQHLASRFAATVAGMGALSVAKSMPFEAMAVGRELNRALENPGWASDLGMLEAATSAAIDYEDAEGGGYFFSRRNKVEMAVVEMWKDRVVYVEFSPSKPTP